MGLKLRRIVTHTYTPRGVLVRFGANIVAITGVGVHKAFGLLRRSLDGSWTREQIFAAVPVERRAALDRLLDALEKGQMVYSTDADELGSSLPHAPEDELRLVRIESSCDRPIHAFERARVTPITISGPEWLTAELADACAEAGATNVAVCGDALGLGTDREQVHIAAVDLAGGAESCDQRLAADVCGPVVPLIVYGDKILAGPFDQNWPTACRRCLVAAYQEEAPSRTPVARPQLELGVALAARVLVQRWLDLQTAVVAPESAALFYAIDLHTRDISLHPLPPNPVCAHCRALVSMSAGRRRRMAAGVLTADTVLPRAHKYFTDPIAGVFTSIQEGDLVQLPLRQSAVSWRDPLDRTRTMWTTEAAADVRSARASAVASALEFYVSDLLDERVESRGVLETVRPPAPNCLVASGYTPEQVRTRALFRTVAHQAQHTGSWRSATIGDGEDWTRANLVMAYLKDTGHESRLTVERHRELDNDAVRVRRFAYDGTLVSVVAGIEESEVWTVGLTAVWLHIGASDPAQRPPGVRRVAVCRDAVALEYDPRPTEEALERRFDLLLDLTPLTVPALSRLEPLTFVAASLRASTSRGLASRHRAHVYEPSISDAAIARAVSLSSVEASEHDEP